MKQLLIMDEHNYDESLPEISRVAVRGIIQVSGKLLFIEDKYGVLKLPGGGQDEGESDLDTLMREVREETGYNVIPSTVKEFGSIEEIRKSLHEEMIWHQYNKLYFCEVEKQRGKCDYSENEKQLGMRLRSCTLDEALEINRKMLEKVGKHAWNLREYNTLLLIKENIETIRSEDNK